MFGSNSLSASGFFEGVGTAIQGVASTAASVITLRTQLEALKAAKAQPVSIAPYGNPSPVTPVAPQASYTKPPKNNHALYLGIGVVGLLGLLLLKRVL